MNFTLRPFSGEDQNFLFKLYADTRQEEVSSFGWAAAQQETFLRMQFNAQQGWYRMAYPGADHQLILVDNEPAGRIMVFREQGANRLVDIALLSAFRGSGIGGQLLRELIDQSGKDGLAVRLQVHKTNRARHLYQRSGFIETGDDGLYIQMERKGEEKKLGN